MVLPDSPFDPSASIPHSNSLPIAGDRAALCSTAGLLITGNGICADLTTATICATNEGGGSGTVTSVATGAGLTGGPITTSGTIALSLSGVSPGTYPYATVTVDEYGRVRVATAGAIASITCPGILALATATETVSGQVSNKAVSPSALQSKLSDSVFCLSPSRIASSSAVKCAYDAAISRVPCSAFDSKGTILGGDGAGSYTSLPLGGDGQVLTVCNASPSGLVWAAPGTSGSIPINCIADKGAFVVGSGPNLPQPFYAGLNGTVLTSCSACPLGLTWVPIQQIDAIPCGIITGKGALIAGSSANTPVALPVGSEGQYLQVCSASPSGLAWGPPSSGIPAACLTEKGVLLTSENPGVAFSLQPGADNQYLIADSAVTGGLRWETNTSVPKSYYGQTGRILVGCSTGTEPYCLQVGFDDEALVACASCPGGVVWKNIVGQGIPCSCLIDKGSIIVATDPATPDNLPIGVDGQVLTVCTACPTGLAWCATGGSGIPTACLTDKGALVTATAANEPSPLPVGTDGLVLTACSACAQGLTWSIAGGGGGIPCGCINGRGALVTGTAANAPVALSVGTDGLVLTACSLCPEGLTWTAFSGDGFIPTACITGKGAIITGDAENSPVALPVGSDGLFLVACSACASGLTWTPSGGSGIPCACITGKGAIVTGTAANTPVALPIGTDGLVLTACADCPEGLFWNAVTGGTGIPCACLTAKGGLVTATAASTPAAFPVGPDGLFLAACSACPSGLMWSSTTTGTGIPCACILNKGYLVAGSGPNAPQPFAPGTDGLYLQTCNACPLGLTWSASPGGGGIPCACLNAKGALISASSANTPIPLSVGGDGQVLTACSACALGLVWAPIAQGNSIPCSTIIGKGAVITGTAANTPVGLAIGTEGQVLTVCTACPTGLTWKATADTGGIPSACLATKGSIITALDADQPIGLPPGTDGLYLTTCSACAEGLTWKAVSVESGIPCACVGGKGYLVTGDAANSPRALPPGANGCILAACDSEPFGLCWIPNPPNISQNCILGKGGLVTGVGPGLPIGLEVGINGQILYACSACPAGLAWVDLPAAAIPCSIINKGGIITGDGPGSPVEFIAGPEGCILAACPTNPQGLAWVENEPKLPLACFNQKGSIVAASAANTAISVNVGTDGLVLTACQVCPGGLTWTSFPGDPGIPCSCITAKGALVTGTSANAPVALPVGTDGLVLTACSASPTGLCWSAFIADPGIPCAFLSGKGALVTASAASQPASFPAGPDGCILASCSACTEGLAWVQYPDPAIPQSCITAKGTLIAGLGAGVPDSLAVGGDGQVLYACSTAPLGVCWTDLPAPPAAILCSIITDKGTLIAGSAASNPVALPIGSTGQLLTVDPTAQAGVSWCNIPPATDRIPCSIISGKGSLIVGSNAGIPASLPLQNVNGYFLRVCSLCPDGIGWSSADELVDSALFRAKGTILVGRQSSLPDTLFAGTDGQVLVACSTEPLGLTWNTPVAGVPCACYLDRGTIVAGSAPSQPTSLLAPNEDGRYLRSCSACPAGLTWSDTALASAEPTVVGGVFGVTSCLSPYNTALGYNALLYTDSCGGGSNTSIGTCSGINIGAGFFNTTLGFCAGQGGNNPSTASCNTHLGAVAAPFYSGNLQTAVGAFALRSNTAADGNTAVGSCSLYCETGTANTAVGFCSLSQTPNNSGNTAVGYKAAADTTTADFITVVGHEAGLLSGSYNSAFGYSSLLNSASGNNSAFGFCSLAATTSGQFNSAFGVSASAANTIGVNNSSFGFCALATPVESCDNTAVGAGSMKDATTACYNTAVGSQSMLLLRDGCNNVAVGFEALCCGLDGDANVAVGKAALRSNTNDFNTAVGDSAMFQNFNGGQNTAVGASALFTNVAGNENTAVGRCSGFNNCQGSTNSYFGAFSGFSGVDGDANVAVGFAAMKTAKCNDNTVVGAYALEVANIAYQNVAIGTRAMNGAGNVSENTAVGYQALRLNNTGIGNVAVGTNALANNNTGSGLVALGGCALYSSGTGFDNTAVGWKASYFNESGYCNTAVGTCALHQNKSGYNNVALGDCAGFGIIEGVSNIAIGSRALQINRTGCYNIAIGNFSLGTNSVLSGNIAIGHCALRQSDFHSDIIAIGSLAAACCCCVGQTSVYVGASAGICSEASSVVAIGGYSYPSGGYQGDVVIGYCAYPGQGNQSSDADNPLSSVWIGNQVGKGMGTAGQYTTSSENAVVGALALCNARRAIRSVALGYKAGATDNTNTQDSCGSFESIAIGSCAAYNADFNNRNVTIGTNALRKGDGFPSAYFICNTVVGNNALCRGCSMVNVMALGYNAGTDDLHPLVTFGINEIIFGNNNITNIWSKVPFSTSMDERYCNVLGAAPSGLPYVNSLDIVCYQYCDRYTNDILDDKVHYGIHAPSALGAENNPLEPVIMRTFEEGNNFINNGSLNAMMIKAIQELSDQVTALQAQVDALSNP